MRIAILLLPIAALRASACTGAEVAWGFEGVVTRADGVDKPPALQPGLRFTGTIHFTTDRPGSTLGSDRQQHFFWQGDEGRVRLAMGGVDFSVAGHPEASLELSKWIDHTRYPNPVSDGVLIFASAEMYGPPPSPPGVPHIDYSTYRRNLYIELHDLDRTVFSDIALPVAPLDIAAFEIRSIGASYSDPVRGLLYSFSGQIDRLFAVPEPAAQLLIVIAGALLPMRRRQACR